MNHLKDEEIISYYNHKLEQNEEINLLNHVSQCLVCAEKFANLFPVEELISPTDNLKYEIKEKINDDFDEFNDSNIEDGYVSIKHSSFDNTKVGAQTVTYTATDKWGRSSTKDRIITVTSTNPLDTTYIDFMNPNNSQENLFRIGLDTVEKTLIVDGLENLPDKVIDETKSSPIFKLKVYSKNGILQKTLNIKGSDKLRTILKRINGYKYTEGDRIELWSTIPENIRITGKLVEKNKKNCKKHYKK